MSSPKREQSMSTSLRRATGLSILTALAALLSGCLKAREVDRGLYDPQRDEFRLVMVLENISGNLSDLPYLDALRKNKDHLLAPCLPGNLFGYAPWYLRLADHKMAKVTFVEPRPGDMQPLDITTSLDTVAIKPGAFFVQDNTLCYYHAMTLPGKTANALLEQTRKDQLDTLKKSIVAEIARRNDNGAMHTWAQLTEQEVKALREGSTDHPLKPFMVLDEATLKGLGQWAANPGDGLVRKGKDFVLTLPMTARDRDGMCELWKAWSKAADDAAAEHKDDPKIALQRLPAQAISVTGAPDGVVMTIDIVRLYNVFAEAFLAYGDSRSDPAPAAEPSYEARYARSHHWPLEANLSTAQILKDFADGTLKTFPTDPPVTPGTGLKAQPK
jgi:hypothetical protein